MFILSSRATLASATHKTKAAIKSKAADTNFLKQSIVAASCLLSFASASGQQNQGVVGGDVIQLDELIVTAQKRSESIQQVPLTVSAYSGDQLIDIGVTNSDEIGLFVPGLEITTPSGEGSQITVFLRGAGLSDFNSNNAGPIGVYVDDVYISSPALTTFDIFDVERLEILRGPQGTLYGRNTTGGAIKFVSKTPTDVLSGRIRANVSSFGTTDLEAAVGGPIADGIRGRIAISKDDSDGFVTNLEDGSDVNGVDSAAYRGFLDIDISENVDLRLNIHGGRNKSPGTASQPLGSTSDGVTRCPDQAISANLCVNALGYRAPDDIREGRYNNLRPTDLTSTGGFAKLDWTLGDIKVTSITSYDEVDRDLFEEVDGSPQDLVSIAFNVESETFQQELQVTGSSDRFEWLLGAFYLTEELRQDQSVDLFGALRPLTGGRADPFGVTTGGAPVLRAQAFNTQEIDTYAFYGQASYNISDALRVTLGGRYTDEERGFDAIAGLTEPETFGPEPLNIYGQSGLKEEASEFSWRVAADYTVSDSMLLYSSASRGFKSGGFNGGLLTLDRAGANRQLQPFEPEFVTAFEVGMKSEFADGRVRLNVAAFYNDFSDLQLFTSIDTGATPLLVLSNASDAKSLGVEFDFTALVTEGLTVGLSGAFMDSEFQQATVQGTVGSLDGDELPNTPGASVTALLRYEHSLRNNAKIHFQATSAYRDDTVSVSSDLAGGNGYTIANLRLGYTARGGAWDVSAFVNNLTDEEYILGSSDFNNFGFIQRFYSAPTVYGIEATYNF